MPPRRRKFQRPLGERRYRKLFVIAVEGAKTEQEYFDLFNNQHSVIHVNCLKGKHDSSPPQVLKRMEKYLKQENLMDSDEAWLVVDKDQWTDVQLAQLHTWSQRTDNYGFALSNPKFEYWLLLHFDDGTGVNSIRVCIDRLKRHLPNYDKGIDARRITQSSITDAIRHAKARDIPPCTDWPKIFGSTVYRLVQNILDTQDDR